MLTMLPPFAVYSAQGAKQAARDTRLHDAQRPKTKAKAKKPDVPCTKNAAMQTVQEEEDDYVVVEHAV